MPATEVTERYVLAPSVALRDEPFGGLAYHYGSRRLLFLESARLVRVLRLLDGDRSVETALDAAGTPPGERGPVRRALARLVDAGIVHAG